MVSTLETAPLVRQALPRQCLGGTGLVTDEGPGVPPREQSRIFDEFYSVRACR
jgi:nitrogen-specific signal transduction histidine kinase